MFKKSSLKSFKKKALKRSISQPNLTKNITPSYVKTKKHKSLIINVTSPDMKLINTKIQSVKNRTSIINNINKYANQNKNKNISSSPNKSKDKNKKVSILYEKFIEFKNNDEIKKEKPKKIIKNIVKPLIMTSLLKQPKSILSLSESSSNKTKKDNSTDRDRDNKPNIRLNNEFSYKKKKTVKIMINKNELFNKIINANYDKNENNENNKINLSAENNNLSDGINNSIVKTKNDLVNSNINSFKRIKSCRIFDNKKLKNDLGIKDKIKKNKKNNNNSDKKKVSIKKKKIKIKNSNMKFNRNKYYNQKNTEYINERRQRIEDKLLEIINEKYKIYRPLRMTKRVFYAKDESKKNNNNNNKIAFDNHMCKLLNNKSIINNYDFNMYFYLNNFKDNTNNQKAGEQCNQLNYYNNQINNINKMRKFMSTESFFNDFRRDYNLLDFNFAFLYQNLKK